MNGKFYDEKLGQWVDQLPAGMYRSKKDPNSYHTLPNPGYLADLSQESRINIINNLLSDLEVSEEEKAIILERYK